MSAPLDTPNPGPVPPPALALLAAWTLVAMAAGWLGWRAQVLPDRIPVFRDLLGHPVDWAPRTLATTLRVAVMGLGQLGATTTMAFEVARGGRPGWTRFWAWASLAAAGKTLVECVQFGLLGTAFEETWRTPLALAALAPVLAFLLAAGVLWRSGKLELTNTLSWPARAGLVVSLLLWFAAATLPRWSA